MARRSRHQAFRRATRTIAILWVGLAVAVGPSTGLAADGRASGPGDSPPTPVDHAPGFDRALYARLLEVHTRSTDDVVGTRVDYAALLGDPEWPELVDQIRRARPSELDPAARLAFWIDAYNILTIQLVLDHYPVESIREIGSFLFPVWNRKVGSIEGRALSLGEIEHDILRPMGDPRIHAAIVCASTSCPPLARRPYRPDQLEKDLDEAMRRWLSSPTKGVSIDPARDTIRLSSIFDWFEEDFDASGGVLETIARYVDPDTAVWLRETGRTARIRYFDYDWKLNDLRPLD
jgi:hypothetical protein